MAIRAKAPAHTSASKAAVCAGRKLLIATATMAQSAKDVQAHPQRAVDTGQYVGKQNSACECCGSQGKRGARLGFRRQALKFAQGI